MASIYLKKISGVNARPIVNFRFKRGQSLEEYLGNPIQKSLLVSDDAEIGHKGIYLNKTRFSDYNYIPFYGGDGGMRFDYSFDYLTRPKVDTILDRDRTWGGRLILNLLSDIEYGEAMFETTYPEMTMRLTKNMVREECEGFDENTFKALVFGRKRAKVKGC